MIRKRTEGSLVDVLSPAILLALMSGIESGVTEDDRPHDPRAFQIAGTWDLFFAEGESIRAQTELPLDTAWRAHENALTATAAAYGFRPWHALRGKPWTAAERAGEQRWRDGFLAVHGRRLDAGQDVP